jgi:hypothetical protein
MMAFMPGFIGPNYGIRKRIKKNRAKNLLLDNEKNPCAGVLFLLPILTR